MRIGINALSVAPDSEYIGLGLSSPRARLDLLGGIRTSQGQATSSTSNVGYAFASDGDTGLFSAGQSFAIV